MMWIEQNETPTKLNRKIHGLDIASRSDDIRRIEDDYWQVRSQTLKQEYWYNLVNTESGWVCDCPDMRMNRAICKHSHAMTFFMKLHNAPNGILQTEDEIAEACKDVRKITKNHYAVKSSSSDKTYNVQKLPNADVWVCECKGFHRNLRTNPKKMCRHIQACMNIADIDPVPVKTISTSMPSICPRCNSTDSKKNGFRKVKNGVKRQLYRCHQCSRRFVLGENGFSKVSSDPKIITESLNLVMSGVSYRNVSRHIEQAHGVRITHVAIHHWIKKYTAVIKEYVESQYPKIAPTVWSLDEMVLNVKSTKKTGKGFVDWLWTIVDPQTRFIIATEVSKRREIKDAQKIVAAGKKNVSGNPSYVVTDSLHSYNSAIRKELDSRTTAHVRTKAIKDEFANRPIERIHNEMRETLSARRGLGNDKSAQNLMEMFKIHHNFVKPHMGLDGKTPAEAAGMNPDLGRDKYRSLIQKASTKATFVTALGKRVQHVNIRNDGKTIRIIQKGWLEKKVWREINDILSLYEFIWNSHDGQGFWQKTIHSH